MARPKKINPNTNLLDTTINSLHEASINQTVSTSSQNITNQENILFFIENKGIRGDQVNVVKREISKAKKRDLLYLVLNTVGGDVYTTVRIVRLLQSNFNKIVVIVPEYAYSSGTVMCLGCDEIHMSTEATLGPLDLPMEHPTDGCAISSLDITQTITNLASICTSIGMRTFNELRNNKDSELRLGKKQAAELAFDTASKIISPIVGKIDPFNLQKGFREAKIGLYYAIDLLLSKTMSNSINQAIETSQALVNNYPSHGYGIFRDEARNNLKLNVIDLENLTIWPKIKPSYEKITFSYSTKIDFQLI